MRRGLGVSRVFLTNAFVLSAISARGGDFDKLSRPIKGADSVRSVVLSATRQVSAVASSGG